MCLQKTNNTFLLKLVMHLSMLSCWGEGGSPGIGGIFELRSVFLKCPAPGKSSWVKKVQIPHTRVIIVGQKNSTNDPYHGQTCNVKSLSNARTPPPPRRLNIDRCISQSASQSDSRSVSQTASLTVRQTVTVHQRKIFIFGLSHKN